ncbi:hypothetical protein AYJ56_08010 [Brucella anthropi]|nr:hypothetical protein AYJ56_08010 [Brucella anthropi]
MYGKLGLYLHLSKTTLMQERSRNSNSAITEDELRQDISILLRLMMVIGAGVLVTFLIMQLAQ